MVTTADKTIKTSTAIQREAAGATFFRKAGEGTVFGSRQSHTFFNTPVQAKLKVSTPDDPQEKEADSVADKVMRMPEPSMASSMPEKKEEKLQRKEEEKVDAKQEAPAVKIQCKADPVRTLQAKLDDVVSRSQEKHLNAKQDTPKVQGAGHGIFKKNISLYASDTIQQSGRGPPARSIPFEQTLASSKGGGSALPGNTRAFMESRFSADFSRVRVHTGSTAEHLSSTINAKAFAHGNDIYFNTGKFSPHTSEGGTLLAHELTHTIQQGASKSIHPSQNSNAAISRKKIISSPARSSKEVNKSPDNGTKVTDQKEVNILKKQEAVSIKDLTAAKVVKAKSEAVVAAKPALSSVGVKSNGNLQFHVARSADKAGTDKKELQKKEEPREEKDNSPATVENKIHKKSIDEINADPAPKVRQESPSAPAPQVGRSAFGSGGQSIINEGAFTSPVYEEKERGPPLILAASALSVNRSPVDDALSFAGSITDCIGITMSFDESIACAKRKARDVAMHLPGYKALRVVLGQDPITGEGVARSGRNFIEAAFDIVPGGNLLHKKLDEIHKLDAAAAWIDEKIETVTGLVSSLGNEILSFWRKIEAADLLSPMDVLRRGVNIVLGFIGKVTDFAINTAKDLLKMVKDFLLDKIVDFIKTQTTAYPLLTVILGKDPITGKEVARNGTNILNALLELGGDVGREQKKQMDDTGTFKKVAGYIDEGIKVFSGAYEQILSAFHNIWNIVSIDSLMDPIGTFTKIYNGFAAPVKQVWDFITKVAAEILKFIKEVLMVRLSNWAKTVKGYSLVTVIIGKDPFTGAEVPRTVENIIHGFMSLMDGGEEQFKQMKESGAIAKATQKINAAVKKLNMTPQAIIQLFIDLWKSFSIQDLINPVAAFQRILAKFGEPIARLLAFVIEIIKIVVEVILIIMQFPFDLVNNIIAKALQAYQKIKSDPIGFLKNLLRAIKEGFMQFFDNILKHLLAGLTGWLMSELKDANVKAPKDFKLGTIIGWVLDLLGISMEKIWEKLAKHPKIGPARVAKIRGMISKLEGIWTFIKDVQERGMAAIWDKIVEKLNSLWDTVLDSIKNWIMEQIVNKMITKLLSMLDPTGIMAVVNSAIALYSAIQSFIKYLKQMLEIVNSFVEGVVEIANGNTKKAANYLEGTLARAVPIVIGFFANQVGLSGVGKKVGEMIEKVRHLVDKALTWLVNKAVDTGFALMEKLMGTGKTDEKNKGAITKDENYIEPFDIGSENHKLTASIKNNQLAITMASNEDLSLEFRISNAISKVKSDTARDDNEKKKILNYLNPALGKVQNLRSEYQTYINNINRIPFEQFVKPKISDIVNSLRPLEKYKVEGIHDLISAPKKRKIPGGFDIRKNLYNKTAPNQWKTLSETFKKGPVSIISAKCYSIKTLYDDKSNPGNEASAITQWKQLKDTEKIPSWAPPVTLYDHLRDFKKFKYETDHKDSLGVFWNAGENNKTDAERSKTLLLESNLQVLTDEANLKKSGIAFERIVGPDFESQAVYSPKGSNKIGDIAFEEG